MTDPFLFVSHVSEDRPEAMEIVAALERRNIRCWIAPRDVHPGRPFDDEISDAIDGCRAMLLVFSDHCNDHEYIRREVTVAGEAQKLVIPLRIEDAHPKHGLRVRLADLHWIDGFVAREQAVDAVAQALGLDTTTTRGAAGVETLSTSTNPLGEYPNQSSDLQDPSQVEKPKTIPSHVSTPDTAGASAASATAPSRSSR